MVTKLSEGIFISIETFYQEDYSNPVINEYAFAYRITIVNRNSFSIRLLKREWVILDSNADKKEMEGDGGIGFRPILPPGEQYQFISGCTLKTEMGQINGKFILENLTNQSIFYAELPVFRMTAPFKMN